jgi:hypothetical protein
MMRIVTTLAFAVMLIASCSEQKPFNAEQWFQENKEIILAQATAPTDSVMRRNWSNDSPEREFFYRQGMLVVEKRYRDTGFPAIEKYYSNDGDYEFRREFCPDGSVSFEGIYYKGFGYGMSTWWGCGVPTQERGVRIKDKKVGNWLTIDSKGTQGQTDYGNEQLIESLKEMQVPQQ